jgi:hypothetical protein
VQKLVLSSAWDQAVRHEAWGWAVFSGGVETELLAMPNVRAELPAEEGDVSLVCESAEGTARQAYAACRSGSARARG